METQYQQDLLKLLKIQQKIKDVHPFLEKLFPVVIAQDGRFLIYDTEPETQHYQLVRDEAAPMPVPKGVRAAFPLDLYDNRTVCVVTGEVFDDLKGYVIIFHEFIHCQQAENIEPELKQTLNIARKAMENEDSMWEINHPFPYENPDFVRLYQSFLSQQTLPDLENTRRLLKDFLSEVDYEYMIWQEWKEGFARFIENKIYQKLGLPENNYGTAQPFDRVVFYAGGAHYIEKLSQQDPAIPLDLNMLFSRLQ